MAKHPMINRTIVVLFVIFGILQGILYINQNLYPIPEYITGTIEFIIIIALAYLVVSILLKLSVDKMISWIGKEMDAEQKIFFSKIYSFILYSLATVFVMRHIGFTTDNISLILGFIATGLAFAVRDVLLALVVWFILLTKRPFRIGDFIKVGDDEGKVVHIGTFFVFLDDTPDRKEDFTRIPNKVFLEKSIKNFGRHEVLTYVRYPISSIPKDIEKIFGRIKKEFDEKITEIYVQSDDKGIYVGVEIRETYADRKITGTKVLAEISKHFKSMEKK